jgi:Phytanoyl-CoA dioxygenase (PhyH)
MGWRQSVRDWSTRATALASSDTPRSDESSSGQEVSTVRRLSELERYTFDLQGYLLFENVLDTRMVPRLMDSINRQQVPEADETIQRQRFGGGGALFAWDRAFCDLIDHPLALAILKEFIGPYVRLDHAYGITMAPGTAGLGLHGPAQPFDSSQYYVPRMGVTRSGLLSLSWSLSDARRDYGGFGCIPGSHRASFPVPAGADSLLVEVAQPVGSLLVFTEALVHCTIPWCGPETRWTVIYKYSPGSTAWDPNPAAYPEQIAAMTTRQRLFFQPPSVGGRTPTIT